MKPLISRPAQRNKVPVRRWAAAALGSRQTDVLKINQLNRRKHDSQTRSASTGCEKGENITLNYLQISHYDDNNKYSNGRTMNWFPVCVLHMTSGFYAWWREVDLNWLKAPLKHSIVDINWLIACWTSRSHHGLSCTEWQTCVTLVTML